MFALFVTTINPSCKTTSAVTAAGVITLEKNPQRIHNVFTTYSGRPALGISVLYAQNTYYV
jgi:hypothetical protein